MVGRDGPAQRQLVGKRCRGEAGAPRVISVHRPIRGCHVASHGGGDGRQATCRDQQPARGSAGEWGVTPSNTKTVGKLAYPLRASEPDSPRGRELQVAGFRQITIFKAGRSPKRRVKWWNRSPWRATAWLNSVHCFWEPFGETRRGGGLAVSGWYWSGPRRPLCYQWCISPTNLARKQAKTDGTLAPPRLDDDLHVRLDIRAVSAFGAAGLRLRKRMVFLVPPPQNNGEINAPINAGSV